MKEIKNKQQIVEEKRIIGQEMETLVKCMLRIC